jgi:hypothetical protein
MPHPTSRVLAASILLIGAAAAHAAPARITDGTSNTILLSEAPPRDPAADPGTITDGTSNTILLPEVSPPRAEATGAQALLDGARKLRAGDLALRDPFPATLTFDTEAATFSLAVELLEEDVLLTGHLVAKGTKSNRFKLFLDAGSRDLFTDLLAKQARTAAGRAFGAVLGENVRLELTLDAAAARLKVKCNILTAALGEIVFKANLAGGVEF